MVIAVWMLGVGTLRDLALIQLVGVVVGTFSSVFLATPVGDPEGATARSPNTRPRFWPDGRGSTPVSRWPSGATAHATPPPDEAAPARRAMPRATGKRRRTR